MLKVNRKDTTMPIWQQLLNQAIDHIASGKWPPGEQLIPSRELALQLGVSRSTIQLVYEELLARGFIVTSRRGGTRVSSSWSHVKEIPTPLPDGPVLPSLPHLTSSIHLLHDWLKGEEAGEISIDFSPHEPYIDDVFQKLWRQTYHHASACMRPSDWAYGDAYGYLPLREQIQRYLSLVRGIHVQTDQILLTSGAQHGIDLIAQSLLSEGENVAIEDPGYPAAWLAMKNRKMRVLPIPVDEYGLVVDDVPPDTKLTFVTPSHQCAVGVVMSEPRRQQLLHFALKNQSWILEDDYDSEFRYHGDPLPTLFSQAPNNTLYLMSFSKMVAPGLRLAALVGSSEAIAQIARVQELSYRHLPIMESITLSRFIEQGHCMRHMRRVRNMYRRRHETMSKAIQASGLTKRLKLSGIETGSHMLLEADAWFDERNVTSQLLQRGVRVYPLSPYCQESSRRGWVLGFAKVEEQLIVEGIQHFADIFLRS
ncbi:aminotransferase class I/II-fold pyridoxal phosphate-dependent enzyme [Paenibacillus sp. 5J-6]|uniref:Aminotransferase class I/II-fold pyridoxal phosphate-dependent enzyme n=1 Tax=Paenibacillus silvestris TaxID=2606219 RepID=A0A6L8V8B1_9BACL|nr:PLP-dependent aminotransferase family protein [Paenibacillus silvestris]MZQ86444.1 aminotransferase class I/II-fold pyridoxal phosphate-dependent enzyme [Paenibacillus silvestris]